MMRNALRAGFPRRAIRLCRRLSGGGASPVASDKTSERLPPVTFDQNEEFSKTGAIFDMRSALTLTLTLTLPGPPCPKSYTP